MAKLPDPDCSKCSGKGNVDWYDGINPPYQSPCSCLYEPSWQQWLAERRAASTMQVEIIPFNLIKGWGLQDDGNLFGRDDGKFFNGIGVQISTAGREVQTWGQPMWREVGEGAILLVIDRTSLRLLINAKIEPGNGVDGCVLLAPTLQASLSNRKQAHGGSRPPRGNLIDGEGLQWIRIAQDGGRMFRKFNSFGLVLCNDADIGDLRPDERWFTWAELQAAIIAGDCNEHLVQAVALAHACGHL